MTYLVTLYNADLCVSRAGHTCATKRAAYKSAFANAGFALVHGHVAEFDNLFKQACASMHGKPSCTRVCVTDSARRCSVEIIRA